MSVLLTLALLGLVLSLASFGGLCYAGEPAKAKNDLDVSTRVPFRDDLRAMKELSLRRLAEKDCNATVYRFLWFPSFHGPISVRFVKSGQGVVLHMVRLKGGHDYEPEKTVVRQSKSAKLSPAHWDWIENRLAKANFWTIPTEKSQPFGRDVTDGDFLVVEGVRSGKYHAVIRHSPPVGDLVELCRAMLFMSGIDHDTRKLWFEYRG